MCLIGKRFTCPPRSDFIIGRCGPAFAFVLQLVVSLQHLLSSLCTASPGGGPRLLGGGCEVQRFATGLFEPLGPVLLWGCLGERTPSATLVYMIYSDILCTVPCMIYTHMTQYMICVVFFSVAPLCTLYKGDLSKTVILSVGKRYGTSKKMDTH